MGRKAFYPFDLIYINKVTKRQVFVEKTDKMFVISIFCCNFATDFTKIIVLTNNINQK